MSNDDAKGPKFCLGSQLLERHLTQEGLTPYAAEALSGAPSGIIGRLLRGERGAGLRLALRLRDSFGVPVEAWAEPAAGE